MHEIPSSLPPASACERARLSRDARFDGLFFTAVRSTGIYCRPVCPAPAARRDHVRYYASAAAAEADGYRPCRRCRPELAPNRGPSGQAGHIVDAALREIGAGALDERGMAELAADLGVGERQLRRLFAQRVGAAPSQVQATRRLLFAKQLLAETRLPITEVALASGFRSVRRFNAAFARANGVPPRALRQGRAELDAGPLVLRLAYRPPYAFGALLAFLRDRALPGVEAVDATGYARTFGTADAPGWLRVDAWPGNANALRLTLHGARPRQLLDCVTRTRRLFDLDADPAAIGEVLAADPLLGALHAREPGLRVAGSWDGFEIAVRAVLGQQVSVAAARTFAARIVDRCGPVTPAWPGQPGLGHLFPTPAALASAGVDGVGLTTGRAATIRTMAQALVDGRVDFRAGQSLASFVRSWTALPGIGPWTAQYIAMRALGDPDAFPAGDLILRRAAAAGGPALTERALLARAAAWQPWRAYAVIHLWRASGELAPARRKPTTRSRKP